VAPANASFFHRDNCRLCASTDLTNVLSIPPTPPANAFVGADQVSQTQQAFPLDLWYCTDCGHLQLLDVVDPSVLFENYVYVSGTSPAFVKHFRDYSEHILKTYDLKQDGLVVDIGSNDGTLLKQFKDQGMQVLGVDPARDISAAATASGIETLNAFFDSDIAADMRRSHGEAQCVTANNVFAHIDDLGEIVKGISLLLASDGVFAFEVSYRLDVLQDTLFDTIYHEHLDYHAVKPLRDFFARNDMVLIDVERVPTHGGSLRGIAQRANGPRPINASVADLIAVEEQAGLYQVSRYQEFSRQIDDLGSNLRRLLDDIKSQGKTVAGFGAPAKATTLMYRFGLDQSDIAYIVDDSPLKQGLYSPGLHIPVVPKEHLETHPVDYLLILAWNFADPIIRNNQQVLDNGGHFIVPVPDLQVVSSKQTG
jgi:SAM-dependent methyltransferase